MPRPEGRLTALRLREVYRPIHMQVLPTVVWSTDHLRIAPRDAFDCSVALTCNAGQYEIVHVLPDAQPIISLLHSGSGSVAAAVACQSRVVEAGQDLDPSFRTRHTQAICVEAHFEKQVSSDEEALRGAASSRAPQALPVWRGRIQGCESLLPI